MTSINDTNLICCPKFEPTKWDDKIFEWDNKKFIKDKVCTFMYMPLNFGSVMKRFDEKITKASAEVPDYLCLSEHLSSWKMNLYLAVDKEIDNAVNITISGKYYCKIYEGNFKDTGKWIKDFENTTNLKGFKIEKTYMWYTTCPKCSKKYGKNYVAIFGQVKQ